MSSGEPARPTKFSHPDEAAEQLGALRALVTGATQALLGATISVTDADWRQPSRLPSWSRAHVATHIARHADAMARLASWASTGVRQKMYASAEQRDAEIEAGAGHSGLELQIDLDTSAGRLSEAFESVDHAQAWGAEVEFRGGLVMPARLLPLGRLMEVVVHHVDLDIGFAFSDIDVQTVEWLIEWSAFRLSGRSDYPRVLLVCDSGFEITVGSSGDVRTVSGASADLLGWLTGRTAGDPLHGAAEVDLPSFG